MKFAKKQLASIPANERNLIFLFGHYHNQAAILQRLLIQSTGGQASASILEDARAIQNFTLLRFLVGVIHEAWTSISKGQNARLLTELRPFEGDADQMYLDLKRQFGGSNLLAKVRNDFAFHMPEPKAMETGFAYAPEEDRWSIFAAETNTNSYYMMAELVVGYGVLSLDTGLAPLDAFKKLLDEAISAAEKLSFVGGAVIFSILRKNGIDKEIPENGENVEIEGLPFIERLQLFPFTDYETRLVPDEAVR